MGSGFSKTNNEKKQRNSKKVLAKRALSLPTGDHVTMKKESDMHRTHTDGDFHVDFNTNDVKLDLLKKEETDGISQILVAQPGDGCVDQNIASLQKLEIFDWMTSQELYNLIVAETWQSSVQMHDVGYMLLVDCRDKAQYSAMHIVTARHHSALYSEHGILLPSQLKMFHVVILYSYSPSCANLHEVSRKLVEDKVEHHLLESSYSEFHLRYPFLCSSQAVFSPDTRKTLRTMPSEVLPGCLYQGNAKHASDKYIVDSLGITHIVNVTLDQPNQFEDSVKYLRIQLDDKPHVDLCSWLPRTTAFIKSAISNDQIERFKLLLSNKTPHTNEIIDSGAESVKVCTTEMICQGCVLVHCNLGKSRSSTIVLGYLMQALKWSLHDASCWLKDCRPHVRPNVGFLDQLLAYEKEVYGKSVSTLNDLPF